MINPRSVICTQTNPDFTARLTSAVYVQKGHLQWTDSFDDWGDSLDRYFPRVALLDLDQNPSSGHAPDTEQCPTTIQSPSSVYPWKATLQRVKLRPHTKYIPILAFSQNDQAALSTASNLGADQAWLAAALIEALPQVLQQRFDPPTLYVDGWDEQLPDLALRGLRYFNAGDFFEQHELLEDAWRAEARPIRELYQGILQIGVAFYQIELGNWKGAIKTFRRGLPKLRTLPPVSQGIELAPFRAAAEEIHAELTALGPENMAQFDQSRFPQIHYSH